MSEYPRSPRLMKGALLSYDVDALAPVPRVIIFQYNPESLTRSFAEQAGANNGQIDLSGADATQPGSIAGAMAAAGLNLPARDATAKQKAPQVTGPAAESIQLQVEIDATDQLEVGDGLTKALGIHPTLSALEMLMMPPYHSVQRVELQGATGTATVSPLQLPLVLFVWGYTRVLPVRVTGMTVNETYFDANLNPIHAEVTLNMKVLTYKDLPKNSVGYYVAVAMQGRREGMAALSLRNPLHKLPNLKI